MKQKKSAQEKAKESASGGIQIEVREGHVSISDHKAKHWRLEKGEAQRFVPTLLAAASGEFTAGDGIRPIPPSSVLWLKVDHEGKSDARVRLDPADLTKDAARWGHPTVLLFADNDAKNGWTVLKGILDVDLAPNERLLLIAVGHGRTLQAASIFSALLSEIVPAPAKKQKKGNQDGQ